MTKPILVVGATGLLGSEVVRLLRLSGRAVRAAVRPGGRPDARERLAATGADLVDLDLKDEKSIRAACRDIGVVVSTASATVSRVEGDSIQSVDHEGTARLIAAAAAARAAHVVFVSFPPVAIDFALQRAKRSAEELLRRSGVPYTVLQPVNFMEVWLGPALGFDLASGTARVLGKGDRPVNWISYRDVARFVEAACGHEAPLATRVIPLGGAEALGPLKVIEMFETLSGRKLQSVTHVSEADLVAQLDAARTTNEVQEAYAAMMLTTARGQVVDRVPDPPAGRWFTVRDYLLEVLNARS